MAGLRAEAAALRSALAAAAASEGERLLEATVREARQRQADDDALVGEGCLCACVRVHGMGRLGGGETL